MLDVPSRIAARQAESLTALVHAELERMILSDELAPGTRLNELALAARLGVSRGPLREALRALERDGLVAAGPSHQGMSVRLLDAAEMAELFDARALLQGFTCGRLAERRDAAAITDLRARVAAMAAAIAANDAGAYFSANLDFHEAMLDHADHARTAGLYRAMIKESRLVRRQVLLRVENMAESNAEHAALVDAIEAGDVARARSLGEAHVLAGKRRWLATLGR
jgi:DNA-binding GntR family transcriptional regulator